MSFPCKTSIPLLLSVGIVAFLLTSSTPAAADKMAIAGTLFDKGIELMEQEKYDRACPYLEESYRRDPLLGALIALADCEYERGRLATALKWYKEYVERHDNLADVARQKQGSRLREAKAKVDELTSSVPTIKITVPPEAQVPIVHLDGIRIQPDTQYPVDPGTFEVTLDMFGRKTSRKKIEVGKGQKKIVVLDLGKPIPKSNDPKSNHSLIPKTTDNAHDGRWTTGIVLMSIGLASYITVYFTAGPIGGSGPPGSMISVGLGGALTLTGAVLTIPRDLSSNSPEGVSLLPLVNVGRTPEQPTFFGVQGRF